MLNGGRVDWARAQDALGIAGVRLATMLRCVSHPDAPALGDWTLTEVAVHVATAIEGITSLGEGGPSLLGDISELAALTVDAVAKERDRDLAVVADRIEVGVGAFLAVMKAAERQDRLRPWLIEGVEVPMSMLTCHLLSEVLVHGHDIAAADGAPWPIEREAAAMAVVGFLFPVLAIVGRAVVNQDKAAGVDACIEVRVRGGERTFLRIAGGELWVGPSPQARVDCHLSVDPGAFLLVAWGRRSQWPAIARGELLAWGPKPWLGLKLRSLLVNP